MSWFGLWWVWIVAGFALGVLEVLAPGYIFLGFAMGAVATGVLVGIGLLGASLPLTLLVFAVASLVAWAVTRKLLGSQAGKAKIWHRDINDN
jgi:membrane protein implicated in regulation of membrane protease activity